jgi:putative glycosyltransferase (TIGR04348 family)
VHVVLVTPTPTDSEHGNGVTARRWAAVLRGLGHRVTLTQGYDGRPCDVLVALHARRSAGAVRQVRAARAHTPVVLALTGTDLYPDLDSAGVEPDVLDAADRLVVLQPLAVEQLPERLRPRARVITQSAPPVAAAEPLADRFEVAFLAHLREVKDPLRLAAAVRLLPEGSRVRVTHLGDSRDADLTARAAAESESNPRYAWLGGCPREEALAVLARSRLLAVTSWHEGGANVVTEALAAGVPVVSSRIPGSVGLLGADYPGYFPAGDTAALAGLLRDLESDRGGCYADLRARCAALRGLADPGRERRAWADLVAGLPTGSTSPVR